MRKVLITGASGLLGRALMKEFNQQDDWEVLGLAFSRSGGNLRKVDLRNPKEVEAVIEEFKPDVVIHSAAERRPDVAENKEEETTKLNVTATSNLSDVVSRENGFMLYISTGYVFDGTKPPYKPSDKPNPLNKYGKSKLEGEEATMKNELSGGVLRIPILYGEVEYLKESAVTVLYDAIKNTEKETKVSDYELRYPTSVDDIAVVCRQIAEKRMEDPSFRGIWHWRSNDRLTKLGMVQDMASVFGLSIEHIVADKGPSPGAKRPYNCEFDCSDLEKLGIGQRTPFKEGIFKALVAFHKK